MKLVQRILKWGGTVTCILLPLLFAYSTRRAIIWTSPSLEYQAGVTRGMVSFAWRPESWNLENDRYAGWAGWSLASHSGGVSGWWVSLGTLRTWEWVEVPLWMPTLVLALPTALLWYRDRRVVRQTCRRAIEWLRPVRRKRITFWLVAAFSVVHGVLVILGFNTIFRIHDFFYPVRQIGDRRSFIVFAEWVAACVFLAAPLWGILWAWLYVRVLNHLGRQSTQNRCFECGYDLTGNVSGICPECGTRFREAGGTEPTP